MNEHIKRVSRNYFIPSNNETENKHLWNEEDEMINERLANFRHERIDPDNDVK